MSCDAVVTFLLTNFFPKLVCNAMSFVVGEVGGEISVWINFFDANAPRLVLVGVPLFEFIPP